MGIVRSRYGSENLVSDAEGWWRNISPTASTGLTYTESTALSLSAVFACCKIYAQSVAQLPLAIFERDSGRVYEHPVSWMLAAEPNEHMTSAVCRETMQGHKSSWGNCYAEIERNNKGQAVAIWPLRPDSTTPKISKDAGLYYETKIGGEVFPIQRSNIIHIPGYGYDGYKGYCPILQAREAIGLHGAAEQFAGKLYSTGTLGGTVLMHPSQLSEGAEKNLRDYWLDNHGGLSNAHRLRIIQDGIQIKELGIPPEAAQMLQTRIFQIGEISRYWRIPLHMLNELSHATFSNVESLDLQFLKYSLAPIISKWEQELNRKLFLNEERGRFYVKFSLSSLLRSDTDSRGAFYQRASGGPIMTANECRKLEELPPIDGGDELRSPVNMQTQEQMLKQTEAKNV